MKIKTARSQPLTKISLIFFAATPGDLTKCNILSIKGIDKINQVCYTQNKLENKTNILTNNKNKQEPHKMSQTQTIKLPNQVVDSDWKDDIDYEAYEDEKTYISPDKIKKEAIAKIKKSSIKLSIRNLVDWNKVNEKLAA